MNLLTSIWDLVWKTALGFLVALLSLLLGCAAPQTAQELELLSGKLQAQVQAMKAAGIEAWAIAHVESDEIGSLSTTLRGPVRADIYIFAKAVPDD